MVGKWLGLENQNWFKSLGTLIAGLFSSDDETQLASDSDEIPSAQDMANAPRNFLDLIASAEGVKHGYNTTYGNGEMPLTTMTVNDVIAWQKRSLANGADATAIGRYSIKMETLQELANQMDAGDKLFDANMQDTMAVALMKGRGLDAFMEGRITAAQFADKLAMEWSTLPLPNGESYYAGDGVHGQAKVDRSIVLASLENERTAYLGANDPEAVALGGLNTVSRYSPDLPYGIAATEGKRRFDSIVLHVSGKPTLRESIAYSQNPDPDRDNAYFGYHYLIDRDGTVVQTAPLSARTNHIQPDKDTSYANNHSLGIALVGGASGATDQQKQAAAMLVASLEQQLGIPSNRVVSHGEIQTDRAHDLGPDAFHGIEGADVLAFIRQNQDVQVASTTPSAEADPASMNTRGGTTSPAAAPPATGGPTIQRAAHAVRLEEQLGAFLGVLGLKVVDAAPTGSKSALDAARTSEIEIPQLADRLLARQSSGPSPSGPAPS